MANRMGEARVSVRRGPFGRAMRRGLVGTGLVGSGLVGSGLAGIVLGAIASFALACVPAGRSQTFPLAPGAGDAAPDPLRDAVAQYGRTGRSVAIVSYIAAHPDDDRAAIWHEMLALDAYDHAFVLGDESEDGHDPPPVVSPGELRSVVAAYPGTFAAEMAQAGLETEVVGLEAAALRSLVSPALNPDVIRFLDGDEEWAARVQGEHEVRLDTVSFRRKHQAKIQAGVRKAMVVDGCKDSMGYCTWFVARFPSDPGASEVAAAMKAVWYRRGHPPWKGGEHLRCALSCVQDCRAAATPMDDSCYDGCYASC